MNVLVTGGAGFIGSHICDRFVQEGHDVFCVDNLLTGQKTNIMHLLGADGFTFLDADVTEGLPEGIPSLDLVMHFACPASPVDYLLHPLATLKVDSVGTLLLLERAKCDHARFIMASTSEVYGDPEVHPQSEEYWGNVNPIGVRSVYDEAKRFSEAATMSFRREFGLDARIVRIFNTYGPRMRLDDGRVVPNFISQALKGAPLTVYGDGRQTRSFCYVADLIEALYLLAMKNQVEHAVMNVGNPDEYTILEFAEIIVGMVGGGNGNGVLHKELPTDDPRQRRPRIDRVRVELGWEPSVSLMEGLQRTIEYFRAIL